jgi:uncharacterized protein (TIGR00661 family)
MDGLRILYAAGNNINARIQLSRLYQSMQGSSHQLKVAAFKRSSPHINVDWTLDCLLNVFKPELISLDNENFTTYFEQVKYYNPDLIISDMEYFTSYIANVLDITLWQCSSSLINFALTPEYKYNLGIFKRYAYLFNRNPIQTQRLVNIVDNSNCNFVYSHFGDSESPPPLKKEYEWIQPYHVMGQERITCQHNIVSATLDSNKRIVELLKKYPDSVSFTDMKQEVYYNPTSKLLSNNEEYICNLKNSALFVCEGQTSFLADAFYNGKYTATLIDLEDSECVINSTISERLHLSSSIYQPSEDLTPFIGVSVKSNSRCKMLHEKIDEM